MSKLRIAIWHNLPSGGGKRALYDQVKGLIERGHHVESWCPPSADQNFLPIGSLVSEHVVGLDEPPSLAVNWIGRRKEMAWKTGRRMAAMEEHCQQCSDEITAGQFDLLLVHPCKFFRSSPIGKYSKLPAVIYLQEPYRELYEAMPELPWAAPLETYQPLSARYWNGLLTRALSLHDKRVQVREEREWVKSHDQVLANSLFSRENLLRTYDTDSRVCYLGVDTEAFHPAGSGKQRFVIGLGNIYRNKGLLTAVEAVGSIEPGERPKLVWVGNFADPYYLGDVTRKASELGVDFDYKVLISDDELRKLLSEAAVMIYTSRLEPFGYAPLEANACGTGVVAIAEGGVRETVVDSVNGLLVPGNDAVALGHALRKFTDDLPFAEEFGKRSREHVVAKWSLSKAVDRLEAELMRLVKSKPR